MRHLLTSALIVLFTLALSFGADVSKGFKTANLNIGYMSQDDLGQRVPVKELADYFKRLEAVCTEFFAGNSTAENLSIVVAVKPGRQSRVWFVSSRTPEAAEHRDELRAKLEAVAAPAVRGGPIAFAIQSQIAGGEKKPKTESGPPPTPAEWQDAIAKLKGPTHFDGLLSAIWPDAPGATPDKLEAPEGFVVQALDPAGGKMLRPKDWFFAENHRSSTLMWTISREDTSKGGSYTTGVRVQFFIGIKENTGKSPKQFVLDFVAAKSKEAAKVIETCPEKDQGLFTRICLQTEEGPHRILYSLFWGNKDLDMVVVTISGTTKELWETYAPVFDTMSDLRLLDVKDIKKP